MKSMALKRFIFLQIIVIIFFKQGSLSQNLIPNPGFEIGKMSKLQQVKIEENTLHIINHDERIEALEKENRILRETNAKIVKEIELMKKNLGREKK